MFFLSIVGLMLVGQKIRELVALVQSNSTSACMIVKKQNAL